MSMSLGPKLVVFSVLALAGCSDWEATDDMNAQGGAASLQGGGGGVGGAAGGGTSTGGVAGANTGGNSCTLPSFEARVVPRGVHAVGNLLQDADGAKVVLHGVNRSGSEYACINGQGFFDGPTDDDAIRAMLTWNINAVRIPLNESCWLAISGAPARFSGQAYKDAIQAFANRLESFGLVPILELHWAAPGDVPAGKLYPMPNADHSLAFWTDVATTFADDDAVVFEAYNEPFPGNNGESEAAWTCWRDGCASAEVKRNNVQVFPAYQAVGMQAIVDTIRATGAENLILLGGVQYSNRLSRWVTYAPSDPLGNLAAAWHIYNFNYCSNSTCWNNEAAPVMAQVPVIATEIGQDDCQASMVNPLMQFLDEHQTGYLAWWWNVISGTCVPATSSNHGDGATLALITDYECPKPKGVFGQAIYDHMTQLP